MNEVRNKALKFRLRGYSYNEINKLLGVPKSTLSGWFKDLSLPKSAQKRLTARMGIGTQVLIKRNKAQTGQAEKRAREMREKGRMRVHNLSKHDLLIIGASLYWGEGYKRPTIRDGKEKASHVISFLNTDPEMIAIFVRFLQDILEVPDKKIRLTMRIYPHIDEKRACAHWMKATKLPRGCFQRTTTLISGASKGKRPYNRLPFGTLQVAVNDTLKFHELMGLIEGVKEKLLCARIPKSLG